MRPCWRLYRIARSEVWYRGKGRRAQVSRVSLSLNDIKRKKLRKQEEREGKSWRWTRRKRGRACLSAESLIPRTLCRGCGRRCGNFPIFGTAKPQTFSGSLARMKYSQRLTSPSFQEIAAVLFHCDLMVLDMKSTLLLSRLSSISSRLYIRSWGWFHTRTVALSSTYISTCT